MKHSYSFWCSPLCAARLLALAPLDIAAQAPMAAPPGWEWRPVDPASGPLRVLIIYDMEGLSGIDRLAMTRCSFPPEYAAGQDRLVADVNAVIEGVAAAGVATIDVIDRHGSGCDETPDLPAARLDRRARYVDERERARCSPASCSMNGTPSPSWVGTRVPGIRDFWNTLDRLASRG